MSNTPNTPAKTDTREKAIEYVPFGDKDKIKLTIDIVKNLICKPTKKNCRCTDQDAMRFIMLCQAQHLNPFCGDAYVVGYDAKDGPVFNLITAHQTFLKRAESSLEFEGMESGVILLGEDGAVSEREGDFSTPTEKVVGGWAKVFRKNRKPTYRRLSIAQRKPNYDTPFWDGFKAHEQIVKCAEADALRSTFPSLMGGLHLQGETVEVESVVTDIPTRVLAGEVKALPEQSIKEVVESKEPTPQDQIESLIVAEGFTFTQLQKVGVETGIFPEAGECPSFAEIPTDTAKRLVRAKAGLINSLKALQKSNPS